MSFSPADFAHLLLAIALLLVAAHGCGYLFSRWRQPPVLGEILGGLLLGPTCLGFFLPSWHGWVFSRSATQTVLGAIYQMGLLLLMFCSGGEIRSAFHKEGRKAVGWITLLGTTLPFAAGFMLLKFVDLQGLMGSARDPRAFLIVFATAVAVTSIPVISRILMDLNIIATDFSRIVLTVAVIEDIILYVVLSVALAMVGAGKGSDFGLPSLLGLQDASCGGLAYHTLATLAFFALSLAVGPNLYHRGDALRFNLLRRANPVAHLVVFALAVTWLALLLGIPAMFGAFMAGIVAGTRVEGHDAARETVKSFSFAFFIPIYFAMVGLKLDLIRNFDPLFFALFLAFACAAKTASVYFGGRLAGERPAGAFNLAVALNARGGPGIVLASLAYDARIIGEGFYAVLVMTAAVTSQLAGAWLGWVLRSGRPLR